MLLQAVSKMGYYPTPSSLLDIIASYMKAQTKAQISDASEGQPPERFIALDPCCGQGEALARVGALTGVTETWGAELSLERAAEAAKVLSKVHACAWQWCRAGRGSMSMLFLNPPYDDDNTEGRRLELGFLEDSAYTLAPGDAANGLAGGVMVYIIPQRRLDVKVSRYIAARFKDIRVYRFPDEEFASFSQIVVFGRKKDTARIVSPPQAEIDALYRLSLVNAEELPVLRMQEEALYELPPAPDKDAEGRPVLFRRMTWDEAEIVAAARKSGVLGSNTAWRDALAQSQGGVMRPAMPLKKGHVAMLMASGLMGIQTLTRDDPESGQRETVLVKGRVVKHHTKVSEMPDPETKGKTVVTRDKFVTTVAVLNPKGELKEISDQAALGAFMREYGDQLAERIVSLHIPGYDMKPSEQEMAVVNGLALSMRLPGRSAGGLLPTQKHVAIAASRVMRRSGQCLLNAEMGTGKTVMGASVFALLKAWPAIVICPPHLVGKWASEIERAVPGAVARVVNCVERGSFTPDEDEDKNEEGRHKALPPYSIFDFKRDYEAGRLGERAVAVVSTTRAGLGSGWNAAALVRRVYSLRNGKPVAEEFLADPDTGALIKRKMPGEKSAELPLPNTPESWAYLNQQPRVCEELVTGHTLARYEDDATWRRESRLPHRAEDGKAGRGVWSRRPALTPLYTMGQGTGDYLNALHYGEPGWTPVMRSEEKVGFRRVSIAEIISRKLRHFFKCCIKDEAHQFKAKDTDRSVAAHRISRACKWTLDLTGTFFGGKSTSIFYMAHRLSADTRQNFEFGAEKRWAEKFGVLEVTRYEKKGPQERDDEDSGAFSALRRSKDRVKELPGLSPAVIAAETGLLNQVIFVKVADLGYSMPDYAENVVTLPMTDAQHQQYANYVYGMDAKLQELAMDALKKGSQQYLSLWLQWALARPNSGFRDEVIGAKTELSRLLAAQDSRKEECTTARMKKRGTGKTETREVQLYALDKVTGADELLPKEQWLVEYVTAQKKQGRKVLVYCRQTGTRDIQPRIVAVLKAAGLRAEALPSSIAPENREKWIRKSTDALDALITNPRLVETGLDLVMFHSIVFYEVEYSLYTLWQACRRVWRLGQTRGVEVTYLCYQDTMEEKALSLMGRKMYAAQLLYGDEAGGAIVESDDGSFLTELAREALSDTKLDDLTAIFAAQNKAVDVAASDVFAVSDLSALGIEQAREMLKGSLRFFLSAPQREQLAQMLGQGGEGAMNLAFQIGELDKRISAMPRKAVLRKAETRGQGDVAPVSLRYTLGRDEWYVAERETAWAQASPLGYECKAGRVSGLKPLPFFEQVLQSGVMLDLTFEPCSVGQLKERWSAMSVVEPNAGAKKAQALKLLDGALSRFMGESQRGAVRDFLGSEEWEFYADTVIRLTRLVEVMPKLYSTEKLGDDAPVSLHYFAGNAHWYLIEREIRAGQPDSVFCYASLWGDEYEYGYVDMAELLKNGAELDFHFEPRPMRDLKAMLEGKDAPVQQTVSESALRYREDAPLATQPDMSWDARRKAMLVMQARRRPAQGKKSAPPATTMGLFEFAQQSLF